MHGFFFAMLLHVGLGMKNIKADFLSVSMVTSHKHLHQRGASAYFSTNRKTHRKRRIILLVSKMTAVILPGTGTKNDKSSLDSCMSYF